MAEDNLPGGIAPETALSLALKQPAIVANMVNIGMTLFGVRLSFAETNGDLESTHFRGAFMLPMETAKSLAELILQRIAEAPAAVEPGNETASDGR